MYILEQYIILIYSKYIWNFPVWISELVNSFVYSVTNGPPLCGVGKRVSSLCEVRILHLSSVCTSVGKGLSDFYSVQNIGGDVVTAAYLAQSVSAFLGAWSLRRLVIEIYSVRAPATYNTGGERRWSEKHIPAEWEVTRAQGLRIPSVPAAHG